MYLKNAEFFNEQITFLNLWKEHGVGQFLQVAYPAISQKWGRKIVENMLSYTRGVVGFPNDYDC